MGLKKLHIMGEKDRGTCVEFLEHLGFTHDPEHPYDEDFVTVQFRNPFQLFEIKDVMVDRKSLKWCHLVYDLDTKEYRKE